jgi:hypothetical protein
MHFVRGSFAALAMKKCELTARFEASPTEFVELSDIECFEGGSGYRAWLQVQAGAFSCRGRPFYFDDLASFISELRRGYDKLTGVAELRYRYEHEFVRIEFTSLGHVVASGTIIDCGPPECRFQFAFKTDQTVCPPFLRELDSLAAQLHG